MHERGYITLISVLVVGAIGAAITTSLLLLGLSASRTSFANEQSSQARGLANACAEEALETIRESTSYTDSGNLTLGSGSCTYTVTNQGGSNRTILATGLVGTIVRKVSVSVSGLIPNIAITAWQEVAN